MWKYFCRHLHSSLISMFFPYLSPYFPTNALTPCQAWSRLKNILKSKSKFIESKFSELKSKSVFIESVFYVFVFDFGTTSVYRKITIRYISIQNSTGVISINIELYRFYSVISKWHRFQLLLVFSLRNLGFRPIFYGTGSVQGFPHLGFRSIFI